MWKPSRILFTTWAILALAVLFPVTQYLEGSFPIFTVIWILTPLIVVWRTKDPGRVGFCAVPWRPLTQTTAINLGGLLGLMLVIEPWSHTYGKLLSLVLSSPTPDTTFAWLVRLPRTASLAALALYSGLATLFGEELFFRGWLLQLFKRKLGSTWAVILQALLFVLPNLLAAFALPPLQGWLYALIYTYVGIGLFGGWAAARTGSIWPSLISAALCNLMFVILIPL